MSIEEVKSNVSSKRHNLLPIAATAALLVLPAHSQSKNLNMLERQPRTDVYEFSAKDLIDLKEDGTYKLVSPDYGARTTYISADTRPKSPQKEEESENSKTPLYVAAAAYLVALGGLAKIGMENSKKDKAIKELFDSKMLYAEKLSDVAAENVTLKTEKDNLIKENEELKAENQRLLENCATLMSIYDPEGRS